MDFFGTAEELKQMDEALKNAAEKTDGIEYKGRYTPHSKKFHWTYLWRCDNYGKFLEVLGKIGIERDYSKTTHGEMEIYMET